MGGSRRLRDRRDRLWSENPHCYICGRITILPSQLVKDYKISNPAKLMKFIPDEVKKRIATIDHEVNRFDPRRQVQEGRPRTYLACKECNDNRGNKDYNRLPIEERQERASHEEE